MVGERIFSRRTARLAVSLVSTRADQAGALQQRLAHDVFLNRALDDLAAFGQVVFNREPPIGDGNFVARPQGLFLDSDAVDLDAVGAAQVADAPAIVLENQLHVLPGNVGEAQTDVARLTPADGNPIFDQRDVVSTPDWNQRPLGFITHRGPLPNSSDI